MHMKNYISRLLKIILAAIILTMAWNYIFDTSGLFQQDFSNKRHEEPNQRFVKVRYIRSEPEKYNAFCFGSSRVENIDLLRIDNGLRYYNMTYSKGLPAEWLEDVQSFIHSGVKIKQIIIGLDDFSFRIDPEYHKKQWLRIPYTDNNIKTYLLYLLRQPKKPDTVDDSNWVIYDIHGTGRPLHPQIDEAIEADVERHSKKDAFKKPTRNDGYRMEETMSELKTLKELCEDNHIELVVFINPIHELTYRNTNLQEFNEFKRRLVQLTNYYDFSGLNDVTTNNYYYYETSHYRPLVGDMIVNRIFHDGNKDFGAYVTKDNIEEHIKRLNNQVNPK